MNKTSNITKGSILAALSLIFIYLGSILPTNKIALLTISSFIIIIAILTTGIKNSFLIYIAISFLSLFLISPKGIPVTYILFFGLYGFIKCYVERIRKLPIEILLKLAFFNFSLGILFLLFKTLFVNFMYSSNIKFPIFLLILVMQFAFLIYDYVLTLFITYFNNYLFKKLNK